MRISEYLSQLIGQAGSCKRHLMPALALAFLALFAVDRSSAQDFYSNVPDVNIVLDTLSAFEPSPIAVEDPVNESGAALFPSDMRTLLDLAEVIRQDLDFSPLCSLILIDSIYMRHMEIAEMNAAAWKRLGARYFVKLSARLEGDSLSVRYHAFISETGREKAAGSFESARKDYRALAHTISDDLMWNFFGETGIFRTRICYVVQKGKVKDLYVADYDGASALRVLSNGSINISPAFTPDGQELLFTSYIEGRPKIHSFNLKTGAKRVIAAYNGLNAAPAVSPDGDRIACVLSKDGNAEIYLLDRRGRIIRRLTRTRAIESAPSFSPDGLEIVFTSDRSGSPQIYIMDIEGLNVRRVTFKGKYNDSPIWSPEGDLILFVSRTDRGRFDVCTITPSGEEFRILTNVGANENPHFSPDGKSIIFSSTRLGIKEIFTMDMFGRKQSRLTRTARSGDQTSGASNPIWGPLTNQ